jgi:hypothetical protein
MHPDPLQMHSHPRRLHPDPLRLCPRGMHSQVRMMRLQLRSFVPQPGMTRPHSQLRTEKGSEPHLLGRTYDSTFVSSSTPNGGFIFILSH